MADPWREVHDLRKAGLLDEAEQLGKVRIAENPADTFLRATLAWVYYDRLKMIVAPIKRKTVKIDTLPSSVIRSIEASLRDYYRLQPSIPDLCHSQILRLLAHIGRHVPAYGGFLRWSGATCLREPDDFAKGHKDDKEFPSLATSVARELTAWYLKQSEERASFVEWIVAFIEAVFKRDQKDVWLEWDLARVYKAKGELHSARKHIRRVLEVKPNEFWAWHEAADILLAADEEELALAAYCRALLCKASDEFVVRLRLALATLLARRSEHQWASAEVSRIRAAYDSNGWRYPVELSAMLQSEWMRAVSLADFDLRAAYLSRADKVLPLFYDDVEDLPGSFIGIDDWSKRTRFAVTTPEGCQGVLCDRDDHLGATLGAGAAVWVRVGRNQGAIKLIGVTVREGGAAWDCVPATDVTSTITESSVRRFIGLFRLNVQGFGFVGDAYVDATMVADKLRHGDTVELVARRNFDRKKNAWGWRACAIVGVTPS